MNDMHSLLQAGKATWSPLGVMWPHLLHEAAWEGDLEKVKALVKDNPDLVFGQDIHGRTPLHCARNEPWRNCCWALRPMPTQSPTPAQRLCTRPAAIRP